VQYLINAGATTVGEIMPSRSRLQFIDGDQDPLAIFEQIRRIGHPRVPVYLDSEQNIVGCLFIESFLVWNENSAKRLH
jgi:Mg2+/Co2+ transporter CorB